MTWNEIALRFSLQVIFRDALHVADKMSATLQGVPKNDLGQNRNAISLQVGKAFTPKSSTHRAYLTYYCPIVQMASRQFVILPSGVFLSDPLIAGRFQNQKRARTFLIYIG